MFRSGKCESQQINLGILHKLDHAPKNRTIVHSLKTHLKPISDVLCLARRFYQRPNKNALYTKFVHSAQRGRLSLVKTEKLNKHYNNQAKKTYNRSKTYKGGVIMQIKKPTSNYKKRQKSVRKITNISQGNKRYYKELRLKQKRANERMRQLELQGIDSPAYRAVQAKLEILGKQRKGARGRRFSETGKATYNEMEVQNKILDEFLGQQTSTLSGAKDYYDDVWATANKDNKLTSVGITRKQWFDFWDSMPDKKKDRMFYTEQVKIFKSFMRKNNKLVNEGKLTVEQIVDEIQEAKHLDEAFGNINTQILKARKPKDEKEAESMLKEYGVNIKTIVRESD